MVHRVVFLVGCETGTNGPTGDADAIDYREEMRRFVIEIAQYARLHDIDFIVIPQNGNELFTTDGEPDGPLATEYASAIDGVGREDLRYGYDADDSPTPTVLLHPLEVANETLRAILYHGIMLYVRITDVALDCFARASFEGGSIECDRILLVLFENHRLPRVKYTIAGYY